MQVNFSLLFLTLVFVGTSTSGQYVQWHKPQAFVAPQTFEAPLASASATNGSTLEEIMKELDIR